VENSIEENIKELKRLLYRNELTQYGKRKLINYYEQQEKDYKKVLKEVKRYKNMYEAEHQIHLVRNEQLDRKQKAIIKCNELENVNKELKEEIKSWKKYSDEQEENIILKNNIICNLEFQREKQQKEIEEKDKIINVMAEYISKKEILVDKHCYALTAEAVKQWFEKQIK
jgi:hypothetical protein